MSRDLGALLALTRFEFGRAVARPGARMGLLLFLAAIAIGAYNSWSRNGDRRFLFGEGFLILTMGLVAFGLAVDRRQAFDSYLMRNHLRPAVYLAAKALAIVALILCAGVLALLVRAAASGGDFAGSLWSASVMTLIALVVAPFAMIVEGQTDTAMPAAFVILGYGVAGGLLYVTQHSTFVFDVLGFRQLAADDWASVAPLALRVAIGIVPAFLIAGALVHLNLRRY